MPDLLVFPQETVLRAIDPDEAIEQFMRDTAPPPAQGEPKVSPWLRAGLFAATGRDPAGPSRWGDRELWGSG